MVQKAVPAQTGEEVEKEYWWKGKAAEGESCPIRIRPGDTCPKCGNGTLAYDGLFLLTCDGCGYVAESGASW